MRWGGGDLGLEATEMQFRRALGGGHLGFGPHATHTTPPPFVRCVAYAIFALRNRRRRRRWLTHTHNSSALTFCMDEREALSLSIFFFVLLLVSLGTGRHIHLIPIHRHMENRARGRQRAAWWRWCVILFRVSFFSAVSQRFLGLIVWN